MPSATTPTGTLIQKIQGHEKLSVIQPPRSGPTTGATRMVSEKVARATPAFSRGEVERSSVCESGIIGPATAPWITRKKISIGIDTDKAAEERRDEEQRRGGEEE